MRPILFSIGGFEVPSFFFMIMVAALSATYVGLKVGRKEGLSEVAILDMGIVAVIAAIVGARIFHILVEAPDYYWAKPIHVFYFWQGGFVSLGAFMGAIIGWLTYLKLKKLNTLQYLDIGALVAPVIIFFVRVGRLLNGCCYGKPTGCPISITFTDPGSTAYMYYPLIPLHPTQIYSMLNAVIFFIVLFIVYKKRRFYGQVGAVFLIYYGVTRFFIEFLRGDADRGVYLNDLISTGQIVMLISLIAGIIMYGVLYRRSRTKR